MLMDMLYDTLPSTTHKTRVHFHAFMLDMHKYVLPPSLPPSIFISNNRQSHAEKMANPQADPLPVLTTRLAQSTNVLFLDEFQVTDIADAMILRRLLTMLLTRGMVLVTTSNRHPRDLYRNGIQRESFIPAIEVPPEPRSSKTTRASFPFTAYTVPTAYHGHLPFPPPPSYLGV